MVPGAPKCGTTSLFRYLNNNFNDYFDLSVRKELMFFDSDYSKGIKFYTKYFSSNKPIACDISPTYLHNPTALDRIHNFNPNTRFFIIVRDPLERLISHAIDLYGWNNIQDFSFKQILDTPFVEQRSSGSISYDLWKMSDYYTSINYISNLLAGLRFVGVSHLPFFHHQRIQLLSL